MGDRRRFDLFSKLIANTFPNKSAKISDVAGGKGMLQHALRQLGYQNITSWDKRKRYAKGRNGYKYGWFTFDIRIEYDLVVAMHPDEGTDHSILYAAKHRIPAIICPCCVKPSAQTYWGEHKFWPWLEHLTKIATSEGMTVQTKTLPMDGRNLVMICTPL